MRYAGLYDRFLEIYAEKENPSDNELKRCVERYLRKKYSEKKLERIVNDLKEKYDFLGLSKTRVNRKDMSEILDSILIQKIRSAFKSSKTIDIDKMPHHQLVVLIRYILINFGYKILYTPIENSGNIDLVVYRDNNKIAVFIEQRALNHNIDKKIMTEILASAKRANCEQILIFSNTDYTQEAYNLVQKNKMNLIEREKLIILINDLISNKQREEDRFLHKENQLIKENTLYLESNIKSARTKVRIINIEYFADYKQNALIFKGTLKNTGKRPVEKLTLNIRVYGRDRSVVYIVSELIDDGSLEPNEGRNFTYKIEDITEYQWKNICRYMVKLNYRNL